MTKYRLLNKNECSIESGFWNRYTELVREHVIPYQWEILNDQIAESEPSHGIDNFKIAAGLMKGNFYGEVFQDSDVYKWIEAVGNVLLLNRDNLLEEKADSVIDLIARAQEPNGYLNTYFTIEEPDKKWTNALECHELYCAGHFMEGAVSYYSATGKDKILSVARKLADHIYDVFGADEGKLHGYPGHQEIEIALLKLYDLTGEEKYVTLAQYFIDVRGTNHFFEEEFQKRKKICFWNKKESKEPNQHYNQFPYQYYNQFHLPVRQQTKAVGHAVRAVYMYTAMADLAARTKDKELFDACRTIWDNIVSRQMYITGGIGATHSGEAFTIDYDLPNDTNYSETCASIGLLFFAQKMLKSQVHRTFADTMERVLYNTILGGMNYDGDRFFYVNPLEAVPETCLGNTERNHVKPVRQKWFSCACCPPNIARTIPRLWEYIYTADADTVYVHLFIGSSAEISLEYGTVQIKQKTEYPWDNRICFDVTSDTDQKVTLAIRIPQFCETYCLMEHKKEIKTVLKENGYLSIEGDFQNTRSFELILDMQPKLMQADQKVHYNAGRTAIVRGPLVYCLEEADNGTYLNQISINGKEPLKEIHTDSFGGAVFIEGSGYRRKSLGQKDVLYTAYVEEEEKVKITAIPYFLWNNRKQGEMQVWVRTK